MLDLMRQVMPIFGIHEEKAAFPPQFDPHGRGRGEGQGAQKSPLLSPLIRPCGLLGLPPLPPPPSPPAPLKSWKLLRGRGGGLTRLGYGSKLESQAKGQAAGFFVFGFHLCFWPPFWRHVFEPRTLDFLSSGLPRSEIFLPGLCRARRPSVSGPCAGLSELFQAKGPFVFVFFRMLSVFVFF